MFSIFNKSENEKLKKQEECIAALQEQIAVLNECIVSNQDRIKELNDLVGQLSDMIQIIAAAHAELALDMSSIYNALTGNDGGKKSKNIMRFPLTPNDDDDLIN